MPHFIPKQTRAEIHCRLSRAAGYYLVGLRPIALEWYRKAAAQGHKAACAMSVSVTETPNAGTRMRPRKFKGFLHHFLRNLRPHDPDISMKNLRITSEPSICGGRPCVRDTRIRVSDVLS
jgi:hypothetical protein